MFPFGLAVRIWVHRYFSIRSTEDGARSSPPYHNDPYHCYKAILNMHRSGPGLLQCITFVDTQLSMGQAQSAGRRSHLVEKCDVFISHRGPDTKLSLVGYLYDHLRKSNIDVRYAFTQLHYAVILLSPPVPEPLTHWTQHSGVYGRREPPGRERRMGKDAGQVARSSPCACCVIAALPGVVVVRVVLYCCWA